MRTARIVIGSIVFFVLFIFFFFFKGSVLAQAPTANPTPSPIPPAANPYIEPNNNPDVPKNLHTTTQNVMIELGASLACMLSGIDPTNPTAKCLGIDHKTGKIGFVEEGGGALAVMTSMIAVLYENPVRGGDYVNYLASNFGFEKKAYAQQKNCDTGLGLGYCGLFPLINIWATFRNMIYLLFVVIFMAIGLGIMLRVKIDPRTVMSIENQIPKIIIAIILATFSFAIAGFMVEIMYAVIFLIYSVFQSIPNVQLTHMTPQMMQNSSLVGMANSLAGNNPVGVFAMSHTLAVNIGTFIWGMLNINQDVFSSFLGITDILNLVGGALIPTFQIGQDASAMDWIIDLFALGAAFRFAGAIEGAVPETITAVGGGVPVYLLAFATINEIVQVSIRNIIPYLLPFLVITIAIIFAVFRAWFALIQAYIFFLMDVVTAPFWMLAGLFPGSKLSFTGWFRDVAANLSAFVVAIVMLWLGKLFIDAFGCVPSLDPNACTIMPHPKDFFVPPLIGDNPSGNVIGSLLGIGTLLSLPDALKLTRAAFKPPEIDLKAVGRSISAGTGPLRPKTYLSLAQTKFYLSQGGGFAGLKQALGRGKDAILPGRKGPPAGGT